MSQGELIREFRRDPVGYLDRVFPEVGDVFPLPDGRICVAEPTLARGILVNEAGLYEEHSDFFHVRTGIYGPREAQAEIGRAGRALIRAYLEARSEGLAEEARSRLEPISEWPDAGNQLIYRHLVGAFVSPESSPELRRILDAVVERAVQAGARQRYSSLRRAFFRFRVLRALVGAVEQRQARKGREPRDLLDVVASAPGAPEDLAEVFLSFLFATAGSIGFVLGWSIYLLGNNPAREMEPGWVVQEALRLWPIAWMLGRRPARPHELGAIAVTPRDSVVVCPYLVHRHPRYWSDPCSFHPERWAGGTSEVQAFMPFGAGPHRCIAGALSIQLAGDLLQALAGYELKITVQDHRPCVGPALAPPRFTLALHRTGLDVNRKEVIRNGKARSCSHDGAVDPPPHRQLH